jgi:hypothetical protein
MISACCLHNFTEAEAEAEVEAYRRQPAVKLTPGIEPRLNTLSYIFSMTRLSFLSLILLIDKEGLVIFIEVT